MQILPADAGRSDYLRAVNTVSNVLGQSADSVINGVKTYNFMVKLQELATPNQTNYSFDPVKENTAAIVGSGPTDFRFNKNDVFAVTHVGLRFRRSNYVSVSGTTNNYGNYEEFSFPHAAVFDGQNEQAGLFCVVNGAISLSVQNDQQWILPCTELVYKNAYINDEVQTLTWGPGQEGRGLLHLDTIILLDGGNDNNVQLSLLSGSTTNIDGHLNAGGDPQNVRNLLVPVLYGILFKNVANGGFMGVNCRA